MIATIEGNFPIVRQCTSFLLGLARMQPDCPSIIARQDDLKPAIGLSENA